MGIIVGIKENESQVNKVTDKSFELAFICSICSNRQGVSALIELDSPFLVCDECKNDLKEIIMHKRGIGKAYTEALDTLKNEIEKLK